MPLGKSAPDRVPPSAWNRAQVEFAGQQQVADANRALKSPYLVPGDRRLLQLRIKHPGWSAAELAQAAGMSKAAFVGKFRRALHRTPGSQVGLPQPAGDRFVPPGEAAGRLGLTKAELRVLAQRGTLTGRQVGRRGWEYRSGDLDRVRQMWCETVALVVDQLADMPS